MLLRRSLDLFFEGLGTCWVVTPDDQVGQVRRVLGGEQYRVVSLEDVVPELKFERLLELTGEAPPWNHLGGWFLQQMVKLAIAEQIATDFYLTLDADVFCVRQSRVEDLFVGDRGVVAILDKDHQPDWYRWAERVLGLRRSGRMHGLTPSVLSRTGTLELQDHLSDRVGFGPGKLPPVLTDDHRFGSLVARWRAYLFRQVPWTEYALYHTFLEGMDRFDRYHVARGAYAVAGHSVWSPKDWPSWDPAMSFREDAPFHFSVIQSASAVSAEAVAERIEPFVPLSPADRRALIGH